MLKQDWPPARVAKFRQAGFVYLHVAILYKSAAYAMLKAGTLPLRFGPPWAWLVAGAALAGFVFVGLYHWRNVWVARIVWGLHGMRAPSLIGGAFFASSDAVTPPSVLPHRSGRGGHQPVDARARRLGRLMRRFE